MILVERDYLIMREVERFRFVLSRQIKLLAGFEGQRACDRRTKLLIEGGYIDRQKVLYGVPSVYYLTHKGKMLIGANKRQDKIRVEKIGHDIAVLDTVIYFIKAYGVNLENVMTEKQLYSKSGFGTRKHFPDFIFTDKSEKDKDCICCVELELSAKAKAKLEKNVEENYLEYETQYWIVPKAGVKIKQILNDLTEKYTNIKILDLEGVEEYVRKF